MHAPVERYGPATLSVMFRVVRADGATFRTVDDEKINGRMYKLRDTLAPSATVSNILSHIAAQTVETLPP